MIKITLWVDEDSVKDATAMAFSMIEEAQVHTVTAVHVNIED